MMVRRAQLISGARDSKKRTKKKSKKRCKSSFLNEETIQQFCELIKRGLPPDGVCDYLGIANTTYYSWVRKGQAFVEGNGSPKEYEVYGEFIKEFKKATAEYRLRLVDRLHRTKANNWYRDLAILERRDRKSFGRHQPQGGLDEDYDPDERFL